jgi:hypothetical protein
VHAFCIFCAEAAGHVAPGTFVVPQKPAFPEGSDDGALTTPRQVHGEIAAS